MRTLTFLRFLFSSVLLRWKPLPIRGFALSLICLLALFPLYFYGQEPRSAGPTEQKSPETGGENVHIESRAPATPAAPPDSRSVDIRVNKTLVLINVTVTDPLNRFVTGLEKEH